ncbi:MAG TPA: phosphate ABC transporter substrate-binding protein PstS [Thermoplasmata archaeon]|nr:phosphate ABC transporter substrate-binding protein PstS [Thermoplasmata archaeon]
MSGNSTSSPSTNDASAPSAGDMAYVRRSGQSRGNTWVIAAVVIVVVIALVVGGGYYAGLWGKAKPSPNNNGCTTNCTKAAFKIPCGSLTAAGSTFVYPLMAVWASDVAGLPCNSTNSGGASSAQVNYQPVGSGTGVTDLTQKLVDIGASDAPLTTTQTNALPGPVVTLPDSAGAVSVIYNLKVTNSAGTVVPLNLSGSVIAQIFQENITVWNNSAITALNPGSKIPGTPIVIEHRSDGSGTTFAFTSYLSLESNYWKGKYGAATAINWPAGSFGQKGSEGVAGAVASTAGAIGYDELNYAQEEGLNVASAAVQNPSGAYIVPTVADTQLAIASAASFPSPTGSWQNFTVLNAAVAGAYPIATFTYLMVYTDVGKVYGSSITQVQAQELVSFLWWITHTGQNASAGLFYVPLPHSVIAVDEAAIADIFYNGVALQSH